MSKTTGAGIGMALVFIILKSIYFLTGLHSTNYNLVVLTNIVCVLLAVGLGMYMGRDKNNKMFTMAVDRIKAGMRGGAIYAIVVSLFVYFYYNNIDKTFTEERIAARVKMAEQVDFVKLQKANPEKLANKSHGEFVIDEKEQAALWFSPFMISTLTLVSLMLVAMIYALVLNIIFKNLFFRPRF